MVSAFDEQHTARIAVDPDRGMIALIGHISPHAMTDELRKGANDLATEKWHASEEHEKGTGRASGGRACCQTRFHRRNWK